VGSIRLPKNVVGMVINSMSNVGEHRGSAAVPLKDSLAQMYLQCPYMHADGRLGDSECRGSRAERAGIDNTLEYFQLPQRYGKQTDLVAREV